MGERQDTAQEVESLRQRVADLESAAREHLSSNQELVELNSGLRRSLNDASVGLCYLDTDLRYIHINEWLAKINGVSVTAHLGKTIREVLPHVADGAEPQFHKVLQTGKPILAGTVIAETPAHPSVNRTYEHHYYPDRGADGVIIGISCVVLDVTDRLDAERGLSRWAHIFENSEIPIVVSAPDGAIELVNPAASKMYGGPADQFVGKSVAHLYASDVRDIVPRLSKEVNERGHLSVETKHVRQDGTVFDVQVTVTAVPDENGDVSYRVATLQDISARKRLEAQFLQAQKMESLGILAGGIAHDFNNILTAIMGNADLAIMGVPESSPTHDCVEQIRSASERAAELVDQMLTYSGMGTTNAVPLELNELVESTSDLLRSVVSKRATLRRELSMQPLNFAGDASQVRQVIMNLITNASDAIGSSDGTILLRTGHRSLDAEHSSDTFGAAAAEAGRYAYVEVADTGEGMDADIQAKIFDPFFSTKFVGRGLGLAAVQGVVQSHGGVMQVVSDTGQGSTFTIYFPSADLAAVDKADPDSSSESKPASRRTVLVVDDEAMVLGVAERMLQGSGHRVLTATDGEKCLNVYREHFETIDVVLLDLTMPRMGGEEAFDEIRRICPDAQVILMSGYKGVEANERHAGREFAGFLKKPFSRVGLSSMIERVTS